MLLLLLRLKDIRGLEWQRAKRMDKIQMICSLLLIGYLLIFKSDALK